MYAFEQDVPINAEIHARIMEEVGPDLPEGLILHLVLNNPDGTLRYVDVWSSEAELDQFTDEVLHPVVGRMLQQAGVRPPGEPPRRPIQVVGAWGRLQGAPVLG